MAHIRKKEVESIYRIAKENIPHEEWYEKDFWTNFVYALQKHCPEAELYEYE